MKSRTLIILAAFMLGIAGLKSIAAQSGTHEFGSGSSPPPVNRLGAHFDAPGPHSSQRRQNFQNAVATAYPRQPRQQGENSSPFDGLDPLIQNSIPRSTPAPPPQNPYKNPDDNAFGADAKEAENPQKNTTDADDQTFGGSGGFNPGASKPDATSNFPASKSPSSTTGGKVVELSLCTVEFIDDIELPAQESGQILELKVKEGQAVKAGTAIGRIDDELYRRMLEQAKLKLAIAENKAQDATSVMAAENEIQLATVDYKRAQSLASRGSMAESEREKAEFSLKLAMLKKTAAENERGTALGESKIESARVHEVEERIRRHGLSTNFDGYVIEIFRHPLEWVNAGDKVIRVVRMDHLLVSGVLNTGEHNPYEVIGRPVTVTLDLANHKTAEFRGKIVNVGLERQGPNQVLVKAEVENRPIQGHWVLQPGSAVNMRVHLEQ